MEDIDLTLFLGGTRSGKSALAEALVTAKARGPVWYLATARPLGDDPAMAERIRRHRSRRPAHWHTLECPRHPGRELAPLLAAQAADAPVPTILLDCVTLWMSNILFALDDPQDAAAFETSLTEEVDELLHVMRAFPCRWVLVSGETGLGGIRAERLARVFDDGLGLANQRLAAQAREAFLVVAGRCLRLEKLEAMTAAPAPYAKTEDAPFPPREERVFSFPCCRQQASTPSSVSKEHRGHKKSRGKAAACHRPSSLTGTKTVRPQKQEKAGISTRLAFHWCRRGESNSHSVARTRP